MKALREAVVNALAHRNYEDGGRKIMVEVFSDRIVISSPGSPPSPITLAKLRKGTYKPCSRNPLIAQCLSYFHRIEERGSGFRRMRDAMLDHGLDKPKLGTDTGYFQVTLPGPEDDLNRLRVSSSAVGLIVPPSIEEQLNERQKRIVALLAGGEEVTSRRCAELFGITRDTATRDFSILIGLGLAEKRGAGRSTRYVFAGTGS
ncbi:ATP-binding protein [Candidatus Bipolaricaulota bacterium]